MEPVVTRYTRPICILATASLLFVSVSALGSLLGPRFWGGNEVLPVALGGIGALGLAGVVLAWRIPRAIVIPTQRRVRFRTRPRHRSGAMSKPWGPWEELTFDEIDAVIFDQRLVASGRTQDAPRRLRLTFLRTAQGRRHEIHEGVLTFLCRRRAAVLARSIGVPFELVGDGARDAAAERDAAPAEPSAPDESRVREAYADLAHACFPDAVGVSWELVRLARTDTALEVELAPDPHDSIGYPRIRLRVVEDGDKLRVAAAHAAGHHEARWSVLFEG